MIIPILPNPPHSLALVSWAQLPGGRWLPHSLHKGILTHRDEAARGKSPDKVLYQHRLGVLQYRQCKCTCVVQGHVARVWACG